MRHAYPTRKELELRFEGLEGEDLTELLAGDSVGLAPLVDADQAADELEEMSDVLAAIDADLAVNDAAQERFGEHLNGWLDLLTTLGGCVGQSKTAAYRAVVLADGEAA
ncbi:hypothetical protein [Amycolatopsis minnesotensis]|uniref:Excreted virulence factor EspC (Type VII ESX diderm) n=1 Tax=Amycolatopsis minnesotensis TaxID=337894 RepID=A0ABP5DYH1_9PSEU